MDALQLLKSQKIVSTRQFQSHFATLANDANKKKNYYNVVRNGSSVGIFLPLRLWESLLEDLEALHSPSYLNKIKTARHEAIQKELVDLDEIFEPDENKTHKKRRS